jgi:hypothetical protein
MARSKWVGRAAVLGVSLAALACTAEAGIDEAEEDVSAVGASSTTLACPGRSAFDTLPKGGKRAFVGGILRLEERQCGWNGNCTPWKKSWEQPLTKVKNSELDAATRTMVFGKAEAQSRSDHTNYNQQAIETVDANARFPVDGAGNGSLDAPYSPSVGFSGGARYGVNYVYPGGSSRFVPAPMDPMSMSVRVGATCALLVQKETMKTSKWYGEHNYTPPGGMQYRFAIQLQLEPPLVSPPPPDAGAPDGAAGPRCRDKFSQKECWACCDAAHAAGRKTVERAQLECFCKASNCSAACGATACATTPKPADAACNTCLNDKYATCEADWQKACAADPACVAFAGCYDTCR